MPHAALQAFVLQPQFDALTEQQTYPANTQFGSLLQAVVQPFAASQSLHQRQPQRRFTDSRLSRADFHLHIPAAHLDYDRAVVKTVAIEQNQAAPTGGTQHSRQVMGRLGIERNTLAGGQILGGEQAVSSHLGVILAKARFAIISGHAKPGPDVNYQPFLDAARTAAEAASTVILEYYGGAFEIEIKADQSPVTIADRTAEEVIRKHLLAEFPDHGFFGEEGGTTRGDAEFVWLVDPIDGTKSFVAGYGMFSTQIALMHRGELVVGVSNAPVAGEMAWAARGGGAFVDGRRVAVSEVEDIENATISTGNLQSIAKSAAWARLGKVLGRCNRSRGYGDYYHYHRLVSGQLDAVVESDVNILDIAALVVIVTEAGGIFTDLAGRAPGLDTVSVLAATPALHARLLPALDYPSITQDAT